MGQLTGGVVHGFNLLTPIIGSLDRLVTRGLGSKRERRLLAGALESAERARTLVQRLLAFARRQPLQLRAVDVGAPVEGMAGLIGSTLAPPKVELCVETAPDLPPARRPEPARDGAPQPRGKRARRHARRRAAHRRGLARERAREISTGPVDERDAARATPFEAAPRGLALLMDDEDLVRMSTADDALRLLHEGQAVDLLVTDHLMPGMSGAEFVRKAQALRPGLPALIVSGYAEVDGITPDLPRLVKPVCITEMRNG